MPANLWHQISVEKESCETPAKGFGWSSLHRILLLSPPAARPRSIGPFGPTLEGPNFSPLGPPPRSSRPNQSSLLHCREEWDSLRLPVRPSFSPSSSGHLSPSARSAEVGSTLPGVS